MPRGARKFDLSRDPRDPEFVAWLGALDPYEELMVRLALRNMRDDLSGDPVFSDRIKALLSLLDPNPQEMAALMRRARALERGEEEEIAGASEPEKPAKKPRRS